ncbi:hypothetical protein [Streptomyces sp. SID5789]|uniref:hypothetical protein n=1 Tax=Streptomyces sp. SID5789 TaxID=2690310 RepID=UPI00136DF8F6|nr:hypothetical protein [Streptomyces sp. SID5789]MZE74661.1 hypothetical protein [Streptomyces sp. SID5789]
MKDRAHCTAARLREIAAASIALCAAVALTACGGDESTDGSATTASAPSQPSKTPSASPSESADPQASQKRAVLQAYNRFWEEQVKAYSRGNVTGTDFAKYAAAQALSATKRDLNELRSQGIVTTGEPTHATSVDKLQADKKVPYAKLTDCLDSTGWKFVYAESQKPVDMPTNRLVRYVTEVEAEKWGNQWKIVTVTPQQRSC